MDNIAQKGKMFITQQPILDNDWEVLGYRFTLGMTEGSKDKENAKSNIKALFSLFSNFDTEKLLKGKLAFLPFVLSGKEDVDVLELLPPNNVVLEVVPPDDLNDIETITSIAESMAFLKSKGYVLGCTTVAFRKTFASWFDVVDYIRFANIQPGQVTQEQVKNIFACVKYAKLKNKKIIVDGVDSAKSLEIFKKMGFEYYQGYFFCRPTNLVTRISNPSISTIFKLINLVIYEAEFKEIEKVFKTDGALSFKLLRYMNSYGTGHGQKIETINHALMMLGHKKLQKWISILFTSINKIQGSDAIAKTALLRAKFMENVAEEIAPFDSDNYFMVGLFSLLDVMLSVKMEVALNSINIPMEIKQAVQNHDGKYWPLLNVTLQMETGNWLEVKKALSDIPINTDTLHEKYLSAMEWVTELHANSR